MRSLKNRRGIIELKKKKKYKLTRAECVCIIALCAPAVLHLLIFWLGTQIETFRMMFTDHLTGEFTLGNFTWALNELFAGTATSNIALAFRNTMIFFVKDSPFHLK